MESIALAVLPGDGTGIEVTQPGLADEVIAATTGLAMRRAGWSVRLTVSMPRVWWCRSNSAVAAAPPTLRKR